MRVRHKGSCRQVTRVKLSRTLLVKRSKFFLGFEVTVIAFNYLYHASRATLINYGNAHITESIFL